MEINLPHPEKAPVPRQTEDSPPINRLHINTSNKCFNFFTVHNAVHTVIIILNSFNLRED